MLYLEPEERTILLTALEELSPNKVKEGWRIKQIAKKVEKDIQRIRDIDNCEHEFGVFSGTKTCCIHCDTYGDGMGLEWNFEKEFLPKFLD